jgi:hypothetical protein
LSSKSTTYYLKVVLDLFFDGEVIGLGFNFSSDVGGFVPVGRGNVVVKHVGFLSFNNYSLVTSLGETYYS